MRQGEDEEGQEDRGEEEGSVTSPSLIFIHFPGLCLSSFICALMPFPQRSPSCVLPLSLYLSLPLSFFFLSLT